MTFLKLDMEPQEEQKNWLISLEIEVRTVLVNLGSTSLDGLKER